MKRSALFSVVAFLTVGLLLPGTAEAWKLKRTYRGRSTLTVTGCVYPDDNGTYRRIRTTFMRGLQTRDYFDAMLTNSATFEEGVFAEHCILTGAKYRRNRMGGTSSCDLYIDGLYDSSSQGTFTGRKRRTAAGTRLIIRNTTDKDTVGDTCSSLGVARLR